MADWALPTTSSLYDDVLSEIDDRLDSLAKMFIGVTDTNLPTDTVRYNTSNSKFEKWNGSTWASLQDALYSHVAIVAGNPHGTTYTDVGAPSAASFNSHVANTSNPHSTTAAQVGAPTTAAFDAHANSITNPHSTTAAQVSACAIANNLSELSATAATARSNIGAASAATLSSHTGDTGNPHNVTRAQIGAAASGNNSDITQLSYSSLLIGSSSATVSLSVGSATNIPLQFGGVFKYNWGTNYLKPDGANTADLGASGQPWNHLYFKGKLKPTAYTPVTWTFFGGQPIGITSIDTELALTGTFDANAQTLLRAAARTANKAMHMLQQAGLAL
jgi:hypothetical protein